MAPHPHQITVTEHTVTCTCGKLNLDLTGTDLPDRGKAWWLLRAAHVHRQLAQENQS